MAISKKMLGNKHEYYNVFKHWLKKANKSCSLPGCKDLLLGMISFAEATSNAIKNLSSIMGT